MTKTVTTEVYGLRYSRGRKLKEKKFHKLAYKLQYWYLNEVFKLFIALNIMENEDSSIVRQAILLFWT